MKTIALISLSLLVLTACSDGSDSNDNAAETAPVAVPAAGSDAEASTPPAAVVEPAEGEAEVPVDSEQPVAEETPVVADVYSVQVDATNKTEWAHFDLDSGSVVASTDASWDLAFKRTAVKMNNGVTAVVLTDVGFDDLSTAPRDGFAADAPVAGGLETDGLFFHTPSAWYAYNMETHIISSRNYTYVVRTNGGQDVKLALTDYYDIDRLPAFIQLKTQILGASEAALAPIAE